MSSSAAVVACCWALCVAGWAALSPSAASGDSPIAPKPLRHDSNCDAMRMGATLGRSPIYEAGRAWMGTSYCCSKLLGCCRPGQVCRRGRTSDICLSNADMYGIWDQESTSCCLLLWPADPLLSRLWGPCWDHNRHLLHQMMVGWRLLAMPCEAGTLGHRSSRRCRCGPGKGAVPVLRTPQLLLKVDHNTMDIVRTTSTVGRQLRARFNSCK